MRMVVLFDAVGTLIEPNPNVVSVYHALGQQHGSRLTTSEIGTRFRHLRKLVFGGQVERRSPPTLPTTGFASSDEIERQLWSKLVGELFDDVPLVRRDALFESLWDWFSAADHWSLFGDVKPCFEMLATAGYDIGIASNFDTRLLKICDALQPLPVAKWVFCSGALGYRKPDARFYEAIESAVFDHGPITMVGDDYQNDVAAPRLAGWSAVWLYRGNKPVDDATTTAPISTWS